MTATATPTARTSPYADRIRYELAAIGHLGTDWRHVEAWMRVEHGTLDALTPSQFADEVWIAVGCIRASSADESESLAASYGL